MTKLMCTCAYKTRLSLT